jgi:hypothetical protein
VEQVSLTAVIVSLKVLYRILMEAMIVLRTAIQDLGGDPDTNVGGPDA